MQTASIPLTVILCGSAVLMVSATLARLDVTPPDGAAVVADEGADGELERAPASLAGDLLVAAPDLQDPYFAGTTIYLLAHDDSGAVGLVLNRPRDTGERHLPLFDGGPVGHGTVVALVSDASRGIEVEPGVYASADLPILDSVLHGSTLGRVFIGYAGWGPGQLERELAGGAWQVAPASPEDVLGAPPLDVDVIEAPQQGCATPY
jgi:putative transcriptional regulator